MSLRNSQKITCDNQARQYRFAERGGRTAVNLL
jgi:hypothetical protein